MYLVKETYRRMCIHINMWCEIRESSFHPKSIRFMKKSHSLIVWTGNIELGDGKSIDTYRYSPLSISIDTFLWYQYLYRYQLLPSTECHMGSVLVWLNSTVGISKFSPKFTENSPKICYYFFKFFLNILKFLFSNFFHNFSNVSQNYSEVSYNFSQNFLQLIFHFPSNFS